VGLRCGGGRKRTGQHEGGRGGEGKAFHGMSFQRRGPRGAEASRSTRTLDALD
jgi:hypothetical protein